MSLQLENRTPIASHFEFIHFPCYRKFVSPTFLLKKTRVVPLIFPYKVIAGGIDA